MVALTQAVLIYKPKALAFLKQYNMDSMKHRRLQELDRSDFEIVDDQPDIRGWDVKNSRGQKMGEVEELIVDAQQKKVRYMVVDLDDNELDLDDRKVLIPIGLAQLDKEDDDVLLPGVHTEQLRELPTYDANHLNPEVERRICTALGRQGSTTQWTKGIEPEPEFYKHDYFNDDNLYRNRIKQNTGNQKKESEYERGLRLWERRSQGGILADSQSDADGYNERKVKDEARMEMVRNRRNNYEQRRNANRRDERSNSVEDRIRREGLRGPDTVY